MLTHSSFFKKSPSEVRRKDTIRLLEAIALVGNYPLK